MDSLVDFACYSPRSRLFFFFLILIFILSGSGAPSCKKSVVLPWWSAIQISTHQRGGLAIRVGRTQHPLTAEAGPNHRADEDDLQYVFSASKPLLCVCAVCCEIQNRLLSSNLEEGAVGEQRDNNERGDGNRKENEAWPRPCQGDHEELDEA